MNTTKVKIGFILLLCGGIFPSMIVSGFMPAWNVLPLWIWTIIAAATAGLGGFLMAPKIKWLLGFISGAGCGAGIVMASWLYFSILFGSRASFIKLEFVLPVILGAIPGIIIYWFFSKDK